MERLCTSRGDLRTPIYGETMYQQGRLTHTDLWRDYVPAGETYAIYGETMYQQGRLTHSDLFRSSELCGGCSWKREYETSSTNRAQDAWELSWPRDNFSWSMFNVPITVTTHDVSLYVFIHYGFRTPMYVRYSK